ncbi:PREDICTED: uncharacterized protein LOC109169450 [Ipomoea nil]|uniref:uncharacterized protein LOC109169450 n=1 Tax=Ipomoea nil TaxID=35883 RepID=UPI0009008AC1|nr:PREDICTED: uncharacterized protein LOC109169450 [Ipomoea nil]
MALMSKNKMSFVRGLVAVPRKLDPRYYYWERCNTMVLSWILRAVSSTIAWSVLWINTAEGVWKDLKKRFSQHDVFRVVEIRHKSTIQSKAHLENDMLSAFLTGLNDSYINTKHQIMLRKPLPDVSEAFSMISQQERQVCIESSTLEDSMTGANIFFTIADNNNRRTFSNQKQKLVCSYCGYTGHTIDKCYKKNGYPPGWKPRNKGFG